MKLSFWISRLLILWTVVACIPCLGQSGRAARSGLGDEMILTATVKGQRIEKRDGEESYRVVLPVRFKLSNSSDRTLLFVKEAFEIVGFRVARSESALTNGTYIADLIWLPGFKRKDLEDLAFSQEVSVTIPKGKCVEWDREFSFAVPKTESTLSKELSLEDLSTAEALWFELVVAFYPMNTQEAEGKKLRTDWMAHGHLLLEMVSTDPIVIETESLR